MSDLIVVDTDVVSLLFREDVRAAFYRDTLLGHERIIPFMPLAELHRWPISSDWGFQRRVRLGNFLNRYGVYDSDRQLCQRWAEVMHLGRKAGEPIGCADAWIAATALELDCPLVTHNAKDFRMIPALDIRTAAGE